MILLFLLYTAGATVGGFTLITLDSYPHDGTRRFIRSATDVNKIDVQIIGMRSEKASDRLQAVKAWMEDKKDSDRIIMYIDSLYALVVGSKAEILNRFNGTEASVLIGSPGGSDEVQPILAFIGKAKTIYPVLNALPARDDHNGLVVRKDELLKSLGVRFQSKVLMDTDSQVFLHLEQHEEMVGYTTDRKHIYDFENDDTPPVLLGSAASSKMFDRLANYAPSVFDYKIINELTPSRKTKGKECLACQYYSTPRRELFKELTDYPMIVTAFYIKEDTPLLEMALDRFKALTWHTTSRSLLIFNMLPHRDEVVNKFMEKLGNLNERWSPLKFFNSSAPECRSHVAMHNTVLKFCKDVECEWVYNQDSDVISIHYDVLEVLVGYNFSIIAPFVVTNINHDRPTTNFWGGVAENGFFALSHDYYDIVERRIGGVFAVPFIKSAYIVRAALLSKLTYYDHRYNDQDADVVFCNSVRAAGHVMHIKADRVDAVFVNGRTFANVSSPLIEHFPENHTPFYMGYMIWNHFQKRDEKFTSPQPCEDVFTTEGPNEKFVHHLETRSLESTKWGHRNWREGWRDVDTLSLSDVGLQAGWEDFAADYFPTLIDRKFRGFVSESKVRRAFFMRITSESKQIPLVESGGVYTVVMALSQWGKDYLGDEAGLQFNDCKFRPTKGDFISFPSRLTHRWRPVNPTRGTMLYLVSMFE